MVTTDLPTEDGLVRLPDVARAAGVSTATIRLAIEQGLVTPAPVRRRHNTRTLRVDDALLIIAVAAMAAAIGVAVLTLLRTVRATGATVTADGVVIPFPARPAAAVAA